MPKVALRILAHDCNLQSYKNVYIATKYLSYYDFSYYLVNPPFFQGSQGNVS